MVPKHALAILLAHLAPMCVLVACSGRIEPPDANSGGNRSTDNTESSRSGAENNAGGANAGQPGGTSGASAYPDDSLVGGTCNSAGECSGPTDVESPCEGSPFPFCISSCSVTNPSSADTLCRGTAWQCPPGFVDANQCATNSCATSQTLCCNPKTGVVLRPGCGSNGEVLGCSSGMGVMPNGKCIPETLGITDCMELQGRTCDGTVLHCEHGDGYCDCSINPYGELKWVCPIQLLI